MALGNQNPKPVVTRGLPGKPKLLDQVKDLVVGGTNVRDKVPFSSRTMATRLDEPQVTHLDELTSKTFG